MPAFFVRFSWPPGRSFGNEEARPLHGQTLEVAKMQAAMLYACLDFPSGRPCGFSIIDGDIEVYAFPELTRH